LEAVLEQMPAGVILADAPGGRIRFANRQVDVIWRRPFQASSDFDDYRGFHPDGRPYAPDEWPLARAVASGEVVTGEEIRIQRGDGTFGVIRVSAAPVRDADGRIAAGVLTFDDVTAARVAEERQRFLAEASARLSASLDLKETLDAVTALLTPAFTDGCAVDLLDPDGSLRCVAAADVEREKAAVLMEMRRRFPPHRDPAHPLVQAIRTRRPQIVETVDDAMIASLAQAPEHLEMLRTLGARSAIVAPLVVRARVIGTISFVRTRSSGRRFDAADLPMAEALAERVGTAIDNARLYDDAQAAIRAREAFLARASHELRTPLTSALATIRLLPRALDGSLKQSPAGLVEIARRSLDAMLALVNRLLDASKLAADAGPPATEAVDVAALVGRTLDLLRPQARDAGVTLSAQVSPGLVVSGDPLGLEQILVNLIANAIKFTPGGGRVAVEADAGAADVVIRIRDTGEGIPAEHLERIFEPFFQVSRRAAPRARGTGLGLAITRQIVTLHGGRVWAESEGPGLGSTFVVRLPRASAAGQAA
ncbi:MAG TPA: ATP-binding protein, partial [Thermodesulfobacteriota bacterium]